MTSLNQMKRYSPVGPVCFTAVLLLLTSCGTIKQEPFTAFSTSVSAAQTSMDQALSATSDWAKAGFLEDFSRSSKSKIADLLVQPGRGYAWKYSDEPGYLELAKVRAALKDLNAAFTKYASLLASLAGNEITDPAAFETMTKNLNANLRSLSGTVKANLSNADIALFSTLATESARLYIEKKRRSYLADTIKHNQANVDAYATACSELVAVLASVYKKNYVSATNPLTSKWTDLASKWNDLAKNEAELKAKADAPGLPDDQLRKINDQLREIRDQLSKIKSDKKDVAAALLKVDESLTSELDVLKALDHVYSAIPEAHRQLSSVLERPKGVINNVQLLADEASRLSRIYNDQKK